jgi:hypothetical protein
MRLHALIGPMRDSRGSARTSPTGARSGWSAAFDRGLVRGRPSLPILAAFRATGIEYRGVGWSLLDRPAIRGRSRSRGPCYDGDRTAACGAARALRRHDAGRSVEVAGGDANQPVRERLGDEALLRPVRRFRRSPAAPRDAKT